MNCNTNNNCSENKSKGSKFHFSCGNWVSIVYASFTIFFYMISFIFIIKEIKSLIFSLELELSVHLIQNLIVNKSEFHKIENSKFFAVSQFTSSIVFLALSFVSMICFAVISFFKIGRLSNCDAQLGHDFVIIKPLQNLIKNKKKDSNLSKSANSIIASSYSSTTDEIFSSNSVSCCSSASLSSTLSSDSFASSILSMPSEPADSLENFHLINEKSTSQLIYYFPPLSSSIHLIMCFCLLISRLSLEKFKLNNDLIQQVQENNQSKQNRVNASVFLVGLLKADSSAVQNDILKFWFDHSKSMKLDLNYFNYLFGYLVLVYRFTRIHACMNKLYALILFLHLVLLTVLNLTTYQAFEIIFKSNLLKLTSQIAWNAELNTLIKVNTSFLNVTTNEQRKYIPNILSNDSFLIASYSISWLVNLAYLSSLNAFAVSFYMQALSKLKIKFENVLNRQNVKKQNILTGFHIKHYEYTKPVRTGSQPDNNVLERESVANIKNNIETQYKIVITGIILLLISEVCRIPIIYLFFYKYLFSGLDVYLIAISFQLAYLIFNAIIWIILSFKVGNWRVHFSAKFRVMLWNKLINSKVKRSASSRSINNHSQAQYGNVANLNKHQTLIRNLGEIMQSNSTYLYAKKQHSKSKNQKTIDQHTDLPFGSFTSFRSTQNAEP